VHAFATASPGHGRTDTAIRPSSLFACSGLGATLCTPDTKVHGVRHSMSHFREVDRLPLYCVTERHAFTRRAVTHTRIQESVCARMPHARTCAPTRVRAHARAHARTRTYTREAHTNALRGLSQSALKRHSERRVRRNNIDRAICVARARSISRGHLAALQCRSTAIIRFVSSAAIELDPTDSWFCSCPGFSSLQCCRYVVYETIFDRCPLN